MIKKIYIQPSMIEVKLQHQSIICESVTGLRGNGGLGYGGDDASYS